MPFKAVSIRTAGVKKLRRVNYMEASHHNGSLHHPQAQRSTAQRKRSCTTSLGTERSPEHPGRSATTPSPSSTSQPPGPLTLPVAPERVPF